MQKTLTSQAEDLGHNCNVDYLEVYDQEDTETIKQMAMPITTMNEMLRHTDIYSLYKGMLKVIKPKLNIKFVQGVN